MVLTMLQLPHEMLVLVFLYLDARTLARLATTCSDMLYRRTLPLTPVEDALRQRMTACGRVSPLRLPVSFSSWSVYLAWLEQRRDEARRCVAAAVHSSVFLSEHGRILHCGRVLSQDMPYGVDVEYDIHQAELLSTMTQVDVVGIASGGCGFTAAVSSTGEVYTWGSCFYGTLGHGHPTTALPRRVCALSAHRVLSVAAGYQHCLAVCESGRVFSWGWNYHGQCGHGLFNHDQLQPRLIEALSGIWVRSGSAGDNHSVVVSEAGALYSFGGGIHGQLGHGCDSCLNSPVQVDALQHVRVTYASAGFYYSLAVGEDGSVFAWGNNGEGQLGHGLCGTRELVPRQVEALRGIHVYSVTTGVGFSGAVTRAGDVYTWGDGQDGQLGLGDMESRPMPSRVDALRYQHVLEVSAGVTHMIAFTRSGAVFGWGSRISLGVVMTDESTPDIVPSPRRLGTHVGVCGRH